LDTFDLVKGKHILNPALIKRQIQENQTQRTETVRDLEQQRRRRQ
jgi:hypothetical protein